MPPEVPAIVDDESLGPVEIRRAILLIQIARVVAIGSVDCEVRERLAKGVRTL